jgi:hypothetical protein
MVRKQLYISEEQEQALKARARDLGVSEAELVRRLLNSLLLPGEAGGALPLGRAEAAALAFLEDVERISGSHALPAGYRFDRGELYDKRGYDVRDDRGA